MLGPYLVKVAVDRYLAPVEEFGFELLELAQPAAIAWASHKFPESMSACCCFTFVLEFLQTYFMQWTGQKVMFDLRSQIFRHLQRMHVGFL